MKAHLFETFQKTNTPTNMIEMLQPNMSNLDMMLNFHTSDSENLKSIMSNSVATIKTPKVQFKPCQILTSDLV